MPDHQRGWLRKKSNFCVVLHPVAISTYDKYASSHGILDALNLNFLLCHLIFDFLRVYQRGKRVKKFPNGNR
ncbi:MAG: hypothetical protein COX20_04205 [Desulfobacterales bacterium CG23_combo_of_CG06-09_8_20_14_all_52_9]|nr:MAG: hypothetical protein COX20_04205 [Desulfobacterales bacterium CG23_combo_of_CG06-09_8_20_14_all_52_9]